jgi:mevalonate kinase
MKSAASAPGKVILFGEHFVVHGVKAILCAIDKRITATSQLLEEKSIKIKSQLGDAELSIDELSNQDTISMRFMKPFFYIVNATLEKFGQDKGIEIEIKSEVPPGIGLGSSSAACVAVAASVSGLFGKIPKEEILKMAIEAERTIFAEASGADSAISTFGGLMSYDRNGFEKISCSNDFNLVIANSKQIHDTREIVIRVKEFKRKNEDLFLKLCKQETEIVNDALAALRKNDLNKIGLLMSKNQELLDQIKVSTKKLDFLISEAKKTSYGAKITGAGGGGCVISLVDKSNSDTTVKNLRKFNECFVAKTDYNGLNYL